MIEPQLGAGALDVLCHAFGAALRHRRSDVSCAVVLAEIIFRSVNVRKRLGRIPFDIYQQNLKTQLFRDEECARPDMKSDSFSFAIRAVMREAAEGGRSTTPRKSMSAAGSTALHHAIRRAFIESADRGAAVAGVADLAVGLVAEPLSGASGLLERLDLAPGTVLADLRKLATEEDPVPPRAPLVDMLEAFGVLEGRGFITRLRGSFLRKQTRKRTGYGNPLYLALRFEVTRQAILVGHAEVSTLHVLLAIADLDRQLQSVKRSLPASIRVNNRAASILADHGFRYETAVLESGSCDETFEPVPPELIQDAVATGRLGNVSWSRRVAQLFRSAREDAHARAHSYVGTTHLLSPMIEDEYSAAFCLLRMFTDIEAMRIAIEADLSSDA